MRPVLIVVVFVMLVCLQVTVPPVAGVCALVVLAAAVIVAVRGRSEAGL